MAILDLSTSYDTLRPTFPDTLGFIGFTGTSLTLFWSHLTCYPQFDQLKNFKSQHPSVTADVPQVSVLGPFFFLLIYLIPLDHIFRNIGTFSLLCQLRPSQKPNLTVSPSSLHDCLFEIKFWFSRHFCKLNSSKTEVLLICFVPNPPWPKLTTVDTPLELPPKLRIYVLSLTANISSISQSGFFHLRNINHICLFLSSTRPASVVNGLVTSHVGFCNSPLCYSAQSHC